LKFEEVRYPRYPVTMRKIALTVSLMKSCRSTMPPAPVITMPSAPSLCMIRMIAKYASPEITPVYSVFQGSWRRTEKMMIGKYIAMMPLEGIDAIEEYGANRLQYTATEMMKMSTVEETYPIQLR
jgi:hypothetical protein